ncbi:MAG: hypothetical protein DHS20C01_31260 [marine bacterium B5-7]|nr:MAG: hypothetical protein DHS20C01_31260 [marine bacterium B5-7]
MAIEIREVSIKAVVGEDPNEDRAGARAGDNNNEEEREWLVSLCVERVMELIARQKER